jgi:hypothetical protein
MRALLGFRFGHLMPPPLPRACVVPT